MKAKEEEYEQIEKTLNSLTKELERVKELNSKQLEEYRQGVDNIESQINQAKSFQITLNEECSSNQLLISRKEEEIDIIESQVKEDKIRIAEINYEIEDLDNEIEELMYTIKTENIKLEYEEQMLLNRNNLSELGQTFRSNQENDSSYQYSVTESVINNGAYKGRKHKMYSK